MHERLAADTMHVADWALSRVLLMNDARYPWLILVPRRAGLVELHDLDHAEGLVLIEELKRASAGLKRADRRGQDQYRRAGQSSCLSCTSMSSPAIPKDPAWPGPVWGKGAAVPYEPYAQRLLIERLSTGL